MLNAFRHQRYFHPIRVGRSMLELSAQRLSASKVLSLNRFDHERRSCRVLNAFRHQRYFHAMSSRRQFRFSLCSTPFGIKGTFTRYRKGRVAPLHCAQRLSASKVLSLKNALSDFARRRKCSTPFGIKGTFTYSRGKRQFPYFVLNAFRHQRYFHHVPFAPDRAHKLCSTPFGIKGTFTSHPVASTERDARAQRLSASKVLSHREVFTQTQPAWCSTPFGIKGTFTNRLWVVKFREGECSTPFGIKGTFTQNRIG